MSIPEHLKEEVSELINELVNTLEEIEVHDDNYAVPRELAEQLREEIYTLE